MHFCENKKLVDCVFDDYEAMDGMFMAMNTIDNVHGRLFKGKQNNGE